MRENYDPLRLGHKDATENDTMSNVRNPMGKNRIPEELAGPSRREGSVRGASV